MNKLSPTIFVGLFSSVALLSFQKIYVSAADCACTIEERPDISEKAKTARWMVHSLDWGVVSTISSRLEGDNSEPVPFGNVYSFVDGSCDKGTGTPYLYGTYMDQTFGDTESNNMVSLTLSESSLASVCPNEPIESCMLGTRYGDPESPVCARLTLTGKLVVLEDDSKEYNFARDAFFERHPSMKTWPAGHGWVVAKIEVEDIWLIDYFGGATVLEPSDYYSAELWGDDEEEAI